MKSTLIEENRVILCKTVDYMNVKFDTEIILLRGIYKVPIL